MIIIIGLINGSTSQKNKQLRELQEAIIDLAEELPDMRPTLLPLYMMINEAGESQHDLVIVERCPECSRVMLDAGEMWYCDACDVWKEKVYE